MSEQKIDLEFVNEAKKGNRRAFDALVLKYQNRVIKLVSPYLRDPNEVMDVVQETFIKAYRALNKFRGESSFYTWLYRIAVNTAKNYALSQRRRFSRADARTRTLEPNNLKEYTTPEGLLARDEVEQTIYDAVNELPDELKSAIILRELVGLSYADIAKVMHCPLGTVRSRIFRARAMIDERLKNVINK
jgi:RNA polymerase sigma-70 factor, ECF subfamily